MLIKTPLKDTEGGLYLICRVMKHNEIRAKRKPRKCSKCGSPKIADIIYGYVNSTPDLLRRLDAGKIDFGGCIVAGDDPVWKCIDCELEIYKEKQGDQ